MNVLSLKTLEFFPTWSLFPLYWASLPCFLPALAKALVSFILTGNLEPQFPLRKSFPVQTHRDLGQDHPVGLIRMSWGAGLGECQPVHPTPPPKPCPTARSKYPLVELTKSLWCEHSLIICWQECWLIWVNQIELINWVNWLKGSHSWKRPWGWDCLLCSAKEEKELSASVLYQSPQHERDCPGPPSLCFRHCLLRLWPVEGSLMWHQCRAHPQTSMRSMRERGREGEERRMKRGRRREGRRKGKKGRRWEGGRKEGRTEIEERNAEEKTVSRLWGKKERE